MSLLTPESQATMLSRITGNSEQTGEQTQSSNQNQVVPEQRTETSVQSDPQSTEPVQRAKDGPEPVPYDRFQKVNNTKKEYQRKYEEQLQELEKLKKELESRSNRTEPSEDLEEWLDGILDDKKKPDNKQLSNIEERLRSFEMKEASKELDNIVKNTQKKHDDLDPELVESVVYQTISENPNADIDDAIDTVRQFVDYASTKAKRKQEVQQQVQSKPIAAPRPSMNGSKTYDSTNNSSNKTKTLADAREALYNYLNKK